jgi:hypothetical protein
MPLNDDVKRLSFDTRLVDWNMKYGNITKEQLESHLKELPDVAQKVEKMILDDSNGGYPDDEIPQH